MKMVVVILLISFAANAQKNLPEYEASNGITYHIGDTVKLARGSGTNGDFLYVQVAGLAATSGDTNLSRGYAGRGAVIKKIANFKWKGSNKIYFVVGLGMLSNYNIYIEDAIETCEIADACKKEAQPAVDKYDQLKKLKDLLDQGVLTQEEYDKEKQKILGVQ
jgi:hypothetical protein